MSCESEKEIKVEDLGTKLQVALEDPCSGAVINISLATVKQIIVVRPDGTVITRDASFLSDGSDGVIYITSIAGDFNTDGTYQIQAYVVTPTWQGHSGIGEFEVTSNLV